MEGSLAAHPQPGVGAHRRRAGARAPGTHAGIDAFRATTGIRTIGCSVGQSSPLDGVPARHPGEGGVPQIAPAGRAHARFGTRGRVWRMVLDELARWCPDLGLAVAHEVLTLLPEARDGPPQRHGDRQTPAPSLPGHLTGWWPHFSAPALPHHRQVERGTTGESSSQAEVVGIGPRHGRSRHDERDALRRRQRRNVDVAGQLGIPEIGSPVAAGLAVL